MAIVTVKNKYQVVIPQSVRERVGVKVGDILEAKAEKGKITFTPKAVLDRSVLFSPSRNRKRLLAELAKVLEAVRQDAKAKAVDKLTMRQINAIIAETRRQQRTKKSARRPAA